MKGSLFDISRASYVDGPGVRTTVFFKGCNLRCAWCHNPESQSRERQMMFHRSKCTGCGKCKEKCPNGLENCTLCGRCTLFCPADAREISGREYTVEEVLAQTVKDASLYRRSGGGVTCSGGECMLQIDFLAALLARLHEAGIHTAVDTAGCVPFSSFERVLPLADLFLYDVKCMDGEKHRRFTGADNRLILDNLARLLARNAPVWVRIPVIGEVNATVAEMRAIRDFLSAHGRPARVELLPYHAMGEHKYAALGCEAVRFTPPSEEKMKELRAVFADF